MSGGHAGSYWAGKSASQARTSRPSPQPKLSASAPEVPPSHPCTSAISHTIGKGRGRMHWPSKCLCGITIDDKRWGEMEAIREKHQPKAVRGGRGPCLGEAMAFPGEPDSGFRNKQDELAYYLCPHMKDERSSFFDSVLKSQGQPAPGQG